LALQAIRDSKGAAVAVSDDEIRNAQSELAKLEGLFAEASGVTSLAGLVRLVDDGTIDRKDTVIVEITGSGMKEIQAAPKRALDIPVVEPDIGELERLLGVVR
jgi:threonine synthase